jgi:hypothetical protein
VAEVKKVTGTYWFSNGEYRKFQAKAGGYKLPMKRHLPLCDEEHVIVYLVTQKYGRYAVVYEAVGKLFGKKENSIRNMANIIGPHRLRLHPAFSGTYGFLFAACGLVPAAAAAPEE